MGPRQYGRRESGRQALSPVRSRGSTIRGQVTSEVKVCVMVARCHRYGPGMIPGLSGQLRELLRSPEDPRCGMVLQRTDRGGQALGCWDRSAATIARRTLPAHRPGRLPGAFVARATGNLVLEGASRLDAFSAYPFPTWLPGDAPSGTAGTPEVGPPQSSRTRGDAPQVSYAHGR